MVIPRNVMCNHACYHHILLPCNKLGKASELFSFTPGSKDITCEIPPFKKVHVDITLFINLPMTSSPDYESMLKEYYLATNNVQRTIHRVLELLPKDMAVFSTFFKKEISKDPEKITFQLIEILS